MLKKYIMVSFPEIQNFMEHERWNECIFCQEIEGHPCPDSTYMVPEDLYISVMGNITPPIVEKNLGKKFIYDGEEVRLVGYRFDEYTKFKIIVSYRGADHFGWTIDEMEEYDHILIEEPNRTYWFTDFKRLSPSE